MSLAHPLSGGWCLTTAGHRVFLSQTCVSDRIRLDTRVGHSERRANRARGAGRECDAFGPNEPQRALKAGKVVHAVRVAAPPTIDGRLDDEPWIVAPVAVDLTQRDPDNGQAMTRATRIQFAYDDRYLYVAVTCLDDSGDVVATGLGVATNYHRRKIGTSRCRPTCSLSSQSATIQTSGSLRCLTRICSRRSRSRTTRTSTPSRSAATSSSAGSTSAAARSSLCGCLAGRLFETGYLQTVERHRHRVRRRAHSHIGGHGQLLDQSVTLARGCGAALHRALAPHSVAGTTCTTLVRLEAA